MLLVECGEQLLGEVEVDVRVVCAGELRLLLFDECADQAVDLGLEVVQFGVVECGIEAGGDEVESEVEWCELVGADLWRADEEYGRVGELGDAWVGVVAFQWLLFCAGGGGSGC